MSVSKALAPIVLAGGLFSSLHANAADLYSDDTGRTYGSGYDDHRYADLYGRVEEHRFLEPAPIPRAYVYRGERSAESRSGCPSKDEISRRLESDGWRRFHNPQLLDRDRATVDAQRPSGRPFRLEVDRCTGDILAERPLDRPRYGYRSDGFVPYAGYERRPLWRY